MEIKANQITIESLQESLNQALEERKLANQKIDGLKQTFSDFITQLQSMENAAHADHVQALTAAVSPIAAQAASVQPASVEQSQTTANAVREILADVLKKVDGNAATQSTMQLGKIFWAYIVPAIIMFVLLWFAMAYVNVPAAKACPFPERIQARIQAKRDARTALTSTRVNAVSNRLGSTQEGSAQEPVNDNRHKTQVHLAIIDLIVDLNALDTHYMSAADTTLLFGQVTEKWDAINGLILSEAPVPKSDQEQVNQEQSDTQSENNPEDLPEQTAGQIKIPEQAPGCANGTCTPVETRSPVLRKSVRGFRIFR